MARRSRDGTGVAELHRHRCAFGVDGLGEVGQTRHGLVAEDDLVGGAAAVGRHRAVRDGGHADAAAGHLAMELDESSTHHVLGRGALEGRGLDDAVAQLQRAELRRGKGVGCGHPAEASR